MSNSITINAFSLSSVVKAKEKLIQKQKRVKDETPKAVEALTKAGFEYMRSIAPHSTGNLADSITWEYDSSKNIGKIHVGAKYAIFVEYGTGIVGASHPHPEPIPGWTYDVNNHGEAGWWYPTDASDTNPTKKQTASGGWVAHTKGQPAHAFVYQTKEYIKQIAGDELKVSVVGVD